MAYINSNRFKSYRPMVENRRGSNRRGGEEEGGEAKRRNNKKARRTRAVLRVYKSCKE